MDILYYPAPEEILAGTSMKDKEHHAFPFYNNMAFYVGDDPIKTATNRLELAGRTGIPLKQWIFMKVGHGDEFCEVRAKDAGRGNMEDASAFHGIDGYYTRDANIVLSVFHADCVPMLIYAPDQKIIAAIHAGWPSTVKEITRKMLRHLIEKEHCSASLMQVWVGPSISQDNFEVDSPVIEKVKRMSFDAMPYLRMESPERAYMDCAGMNIRMMKDLGVFPGHIYHCDLCTYSEEEHLFSYRKQRECGRHLSFIVRKS